MTKEEERIYEGEQGWANQVCMKILTRLGDLFEAEKLIPISSAHVSGVSYKTMGDPPIEFLQAMADANAKAKVRTTLNPQSFDPEYIRARLKRRLIDGQLRILDQFDRMGFTPCLTCTPYYLNKPLRNTHHAWAESSAVVYANSVLQAWTNREGGPSALASAVIGKTPEWGVHRDENREPRTRVELRTPLKSEIDYGALGIFLGKILKDDIPIIEGIESSKPDDLKQLGAGLASSGMVNMFHFKPGRRMTETSSLQKISVEAKDLEKTAEELSTSAGVKPDLVFLGCPHCSETEITRIADLIGNRKVKTGLECWICTSRHVRKTMKAHAEKIEKSGAHVLTDMCTVVSWTEELGIKTIMTNSAKTAHYAPTLAKADATLATREHCIKTAVQG